MTNYLRNGWKYSGKEEQMSLITTIMETVLNPLARLGFELQLHAAAMQFGGKAFGLSICDLLVNKNECKGALAVPAWQPYRHDEDGVAEHAEKWIAENPAKKYIIRSSSQDEDWVDDRAGVEKSTVVLKKDALATLLRALQKGNAVLQKCIYGPGCVVDIVYSDFLERNVVRIAAGHLPDNYGNIDPTSATWDTSATIALYEVDGAAIEPLHRDHWLRKQASALAKLFAQRIARLGIHFGVQLEFVMDYAAFPMMPYLVQIRPSPKLLRGEVPALPQGTTCWEQTIRVNRPGVVRGELMLMSDSFFAKNQNSALQNYHDNYYFFGQRLDSNPEHFFNQSTISYFKDKIVLWDMGALQKFASTMQIAGLARLGALGQMGTRLFVNSSHGMHYKFDGDGGYEGLNYPFANERSLLFSVSEDTLRKLKERVGANVQLVSDGVVGRIYFI